MSARAFLLGGEERERERERQREREREREKSEGGWSIGNGI
jgi:hypothetical protein